MGLNFFNLATKGMDSGIRLKILSRHLFSFVRHITFKKFFNVLLTEYNLARGKALVSSMPYVLKIEPSNICNLKCAYCYDDHRAPKDNERPYGRMSFHHFKKIVDETKEYLLKINLYGFGEPFLFPESFDMIEYATKNNIGVTVSSNMNFHDTTIVDKIIESGLEVLIFSCHGVTPSSYARFMVKGNMELAFNNISYLIKRKKEIGARTPLVDWQFCVTKFNQDELDLVRQKADEFGIDQVRFIKPMFPEHADADFFSDLFPVFEDAPPLRKCSWLYRVAYINHDGGLLPCCRETRLVANNFGNVFDEQFSDIWNNEKYRSSRRFVRSPADNSRKQCKTMCGRCPHVLTHVNRK